MEWVYKELIVGLLFQLQNLVSTEITGNADKYILSL